jgi:translation initiation factor 1
LNHPWLPTSGPDAISVRGFVYDVDTHELRELAGRLKKRCGVGGAAKDGVIELQGDHRETVVTLLRDDGYDVVLAGG